MNPSVIVGILVSMYLAKVKALTPVEYSSAVKPVEILNFDDTFLDALRSIELSAEYGTYEEYKSCIKTTRILKNSLTSVTVMRLVSAIYREKIELGELELSEY